jgi:hypothetical protein
VTVQGTSATNRAHVIAGKDISHGATVENLIKNGEMEAWESATTLWKIAAGSSAHSPETTIVKEGVKSLKAVRSGSTLYYPFDVLLFAWKHGVYLILLASRKCGLHKA